MNSTELRDALKVMGEWDHQGLGLAEAWDDVHGGGAWARLLSLAQPTAEPPAPRFDTPEGFIEWFGKNYRDEVVFIDPAWHARIIYRTAMWHARAAAPVLLPAPADARDDGAFLRSIAAGLTYNGTAAEGHRKHRLLEIAMRVETGYYARAALGATCPASPEEPKNG